MDDDELRSAQEAIEEAVRILGVCLGTRHRHRKGRVSGKRSLSRRDHYLPAAEDHVRRYLYSEVLGWKTAALSEISGFSQRWIQESIAKGRRLVRHNAKVLGHAIPRKSRSYEWD